MIRSWMMMALVALLMTVGAVLISGSSVVGLSNAEATSTAPSTTAPPAPHAVGGTMGDIGPPRTMLNPSGLEATVVDREVLLFEDGSWSIDIGDGDMKAQAVTRDGRRVELNSAIDVETGERVSNWNFVDRHSGMLQVVISRAISTQGLVAPNEWSCLPQITVRNLTDLDVYGLVVELQITSMDASPFGTSMLLRTLKHGEARESNMQSLEGSGCQGLTATLHVPYCEFTNGVDCSGAVQASAFGLIPLHYQQESP